ncbi:MAG: hypothetical protein HXX14_21485, partial [Bacteroidetes bacterium]|nr:hypothetical protein [Bacteroidota bacterium]
YNSSFAQKNYDSVSQLSGTWVGNIEDHPIKFEILENTSNTPTFSFTNFQNEKFIVLKSDVTTNEKNEFIVHIKEAKFSSKSYAKCLFSTGVITLSDISHNEMRLNLTSVGPICSINYDTSMKMDDMKDVILTKEKSNK